MVGRLVRESTTDLEEYNYARVLERAESLFWFFCDNYLELVKARRYGDQGADAAASANATLQASLSVLLRLFAPFLPFVTEEVWSWWQSGSIHAAPWPTPDELFALAGAESDEDVRALELASSVLGEIRKKKSEEQRPLKTKVSRAVVRLSDSERPLLMASKADLSAAGLIEELETGTADALHVTVELAPPEESTGEQRP